MKEAICNSCLGFGEIPPVADERGWVVSGYTPCDRCSGRGYKINRDEDKNFKRIQEVVKNAENLK